MRKSNSTNFTNCLSSIKPSLDSKVYVFKGNQLMTYNNQVLEYSKIKTSFTFNYIKHIGNLSGRDCFTASIFDENVIFETSFKLVPLRNIYNLLEKPQLEAALYAYQIHRWNKNTLYCGHCGSPTQEKIVDEAVKECTKCKQLFYPKISPSIIVAIRKNDKLLLALHNRVTNGMPTVLAGFVNPGESLEECIHREVYEEAGIKVKNIQYFGSQPWPFPDSLMIAFKAEYSEGELKADKTEISTLDWQPAKDIPDWPDNVSIARWLIDDFIKNHRANNKGNCPLGMASLKS